MIRPVEWLNYHHLLYFWMTARRGSIARASEELRLRPPTLSAQIRQLEESLGERLFLREGRRLVLTDTGRTVLDYAERIFSLGGEMIETVRRGVAPGDLRLVAGVADALPKIVAHRLLAPALAIDRPVRVVCREDRHDRLLAALAVHEIDVVLSDAPTTPALGIKAFNHLLGECGVTFFAAPRAAGAMRGPFPGCLDGAPFLLPTENTALRRSLDLWFAERSVRPRIVGEFEDSALLKAFGQESIGVFAAPSVVEREVERQYDVRSLGRTDDVRERFWAITGERRLKHPAVAALSEAARTELFG